MSNEQQRQWYPTAGAQQPWDAYPAAQPGYGQAAPYAPMQPVAAPEPYYPYPQQPFNQWGPGQQMPVPPGAAGVPGFPGVPGMGATPGALPEITPPGMLPMEMSYIENILRLNRGKRVKVYMTFENNLEWGASVFTGIVREAGRDHIVISDPETGQWYLLLMVFLNYVVFEEEIAYDYPYGQAATGLAGYPPR